MIPSILHFIWVGDDSRRPDQLIQTWVDQHPDWDIKLWSNEDLVQYPWRLRQQLYPLGEKDCAAVAAAMKWEILLNEGGFVIPVDSLCLRPIPKDWLRHPMVAMWEQEILRPGLISSSYVGCEPGNPLVAQIVERIARDEHLAAQSISQAVGSQRLTDTYLAMGYRGLHVLPSQVFHPLYPGLDARPDDQEQAVAVELFASRLNLLDGLIGIAPHDVAHMLGRAVPAPAELAPPRPLFSVVIPTFNRRDTTVEAIVSASEQAEPDTEIVVVDDGSTDGTYEQLVSHISPVFRVVRQPNSGTATARNTGIAHARGEYIVWLDSDDILLPGALEGYRQVLSQTDNRPDILYGNLQVVDTRTGERGHWQYPCILPEDQFPKLLAANPYPNPGTAVRREVYAVIGSYDTDLKASEDYDLWVRAAVAGARFQHVPLDVCEYRLSSDSLSANFARNRQADAQLVIKALKTWPWSRLFPQLDWRQEREARAAGMLLAAQLLAPRQAWREVAEFAAGLQLNACDLAGVETTTPPPVNTAAPQPKLDLNPRLEEIKAQFLALRDHPEHRFKLDWQDRWLCLGDNTSSTDFDRHYTYHPAWASRVLARTRPSHHIDIGSSLQFVTQISAFIDTTFYDVRPVDMGLSGLTCGEGNLTALPFPDHSVESLSCMHVIEHVGLARYGDELDYNGDLKAIAELQRVVRHGGTLLFVVPMGGEARIQFNAHRIYTYAQVMQYFEGWKLQEFALIPEFADKGGLIVNATEQQANQERYGCGCFWFIK